MRFQVPQFVDIEDKIIGPLTLKQFLYYAIAGMCLIPLYVLFDLALFITLAIPVLGAAAAFAHVHFQGQSFIAVLSSAVRFMSGEKLYVWRRMGGPKLIGLRGAEYDEYLATGDVYEGDFLASSLHVKAQAIDTEGNVSTEDAVDPLVQTEP